MVLHAVFVAGFAGAGCATKFEVASDDCGDGVCAVGEAHANCPEDCSVRCGDGLCSRPEESHERCPRDCLARCGDGVCYEPEECLESCPEDCSARCGDGLCSEPKESLQSCPEDCGLCTTHADVTDLIGGQELFIGYAALGRNVSIPDCGEFTDAKEVLVSFTPGFTGNLVLSTVHRSTNTDTVLEVRTESCDGSGLGCNDDASAETRGSRLTVSVEEGKRYVAMVESADATGGVFALGLHRAGVCEGQGVTEDITAELMTGRSFYADTSTSTASMGGSCGGGGDAPEVLYTFTPQRSGTMAATTELPGTTFDTLLYVREEGVDGADRCDSPEAEVACGSDAVLRFEVLAGREYALFVDGVGTGGGVKGRAQLHLGYDVESPAQLSLQGCNHTAFRDRLAFFAESGQTVYLHVDTVDAATAADTRLRVRSSNGRELYEADDDVDCTYPPPYWSCPEHTFTAAVTGLYFVEVYVGASERCYDHNLVNYQLTVTVDQQDAELILVKDQ
jgi:hypothetical protein